MNPKPILLALFLLGLLPPPCAVAEISDLGVGLDALVGHSDVIALATVEKVEVTLETVAYSYYVLHCQPKRVLKGTVPKEEFKVQMSISVSERKGGLEVKIPEKGSTCWFFLYGTEYNLQPVSFERGIRVSNDGDMSLQKQVDALVKKGSSIRDVSVHVQVENG